MQPDWPLQQSGRTWRLPTRAATDRGRLLSAYPARRSYA